MPYDLSIIIPAHNEGSRITTGLRTLLASLDDATRAVTEVIVVDDGSTDDTAQRAQDVLSELPHFYIVRYEQNRGKGGALKVGIAAATGQHVLCTDADSAIDPVHVPAVREALATHDLAVGSRAVNGRIVYDSALRTGAGRGFNRLVRHWTGTTVRDTQCGFKGYTLAAARLMALFGTIDGFAFDPEWLSLAARLGLRVTAVPVTWRDVEGSSVSVGRDSLRMLRDVRSLRHGDYRTIMVRLPIGQTLAALDAACRSARIQGGVVARGGSDDLLLLPREAATGAIGVAEVFGGSIGVVGLDELKGRMFEAI